MQALFAHCPTGVSADFFGLHHLPFPAACQCLDDTCLQFDAAWPHAPDGSDAGLAGAATAAVPGSAVLVLMGGDTLFDTRCRLTIMRAPMPPASVPPEVSAARAPVPTAGTRAATPATEQAAAPAATGLRAGTNASDAPVPITAAIALAASATAAAATVVPAATATATSSAPPASTISSDAAAATSAGAASPAPGLAPPARRRRSHPQPPASAPTPHRLLVILNIALGAGRYGTVHVHADDRPAQLAARFCATHGLCARVRAGLAAQICTQMRARGVEPAGDSDSDTGESSEVGGNAGGSRGDAGGEVAGESDEDASENVTAKEGVGCEGPSKQADQDIRAGAKHAAPAPAYCKRPRSICDTNAPVAQAGPPSRRQPPDELNKGTSGVGGGRVGKADTAAPVPLLHAVASAASESASPTAVAPPAAAASSSLAASTATTPPPSPALATPHLAASSSPPLPRRSPLLPPRHPSPGGARPAASPAATAAVAASTVASPSAVSAACALPPVVLELPVDLGSARPPATLRVRLGDNLPSLATRFCVRHGLADALAQPLARHLRATATRLLPPEIVQTLRYTASPPRPVALPANDGAAGPPASTATGRPPSADSLAPPGGSAAGQAAASCPPTLEPNPAAGATGATLAAQSAAGNSSSDGSALRTGAGSGNNAEDDARQRCHPSLHDRGPPALPLPALRDDVARAGGYRRGDSKAEAGVFEDNAQALRARRRSASSNNCARSTDDIQERRTRPRAPDAGEVDSSPWEYPPEPSTPLVPRVQYVPLPHKSV